MYDNYFFDLNIINKISKEQKILASIRLAQITNQTWDNYIRDITRADHPFDWLENDERKWPAYERDMRQLSEEFPDAIFLLEAYGTMPDNVWKVYFKNRKAEKCRRHYYWDPTPDWAKV